MNNMRNKILSLLVLLLTAASGAWAKTDPNAVYWTNEIWAGWAENVTTHTVGDITITCSGNAKAYESTTSNEPLAMEAGANDAITFTSNGKPFASVAIMTGNNELNVAGWTYNSSTWSYEWSGEPTTSVTLSGCDIKADVITFTFGTAEAPITVEPGSSANTWTFSMPGSDVVLTPQYAPTAKWDVVETVPQQPAALEGIIAGQDAAIVTAGQSAQGTVMYAVTTSAEAAPALTAFSATVPTAKDYDDAATVYVWYYIQGADAPDGVAATLDNTFDNTEPACLTVQVLTNKFDIQFNAANANTIEAGKATVTVGGTAATVTEGKLQGVKMGSEVKVKANTGYKFRKVEVKKTGPGPLTYATKEGAVTRIKFNYNGNVYYADFTYSNGSFTRTGGSNGYTFSGSWTMKEENGVLTMTANYNEMNEQFIYFVCTFYADTNEYTQSSTGIWNYSFNGIEVNGTDITSQLTEVK